MMIIPLLLAITPGATSVNPLAGPHAQNTYTYAVSGPARLDVTTVNGRISIKAGAAGKIVVLVNRRAETQAALTSLGSQVAQKGNNVTAAGRFPDQCGTSCGSVDFTITVPADTDIVASSDNGFVGIDNIDGAVTAATKNGPVLCGGLAGNVTLGSVNGRLNAGFRDLTHVSKIVLGTETGVVRVVLPSGGGIGKLKAGTGDGKIFAPWKLDTVSKGNGMEVEQQINSSGPSVLLGTGRGDIDIVTLQ